MRLVSDDQRVKLLMASSGHDDLYSQHNGQARTRTDRGRGLAVVRMERNTRTKFIVNATIYSRDIIDVELLCGVSRLATRYTVAHTSVHSILIHCSWHTGAVDPSYLWRW